jgi:WD40 repeat protein
MHPLYRNKSFWLAVLLGVSLLVNIVLLAIVVSRPDRRSTLIDSSRATVGTADMVVASTKKQGSDRAVTEGLPLGYRMILRGHPGSINGLCFSADHSRLAVVSNLAYLTVWNLDSQEIDWETHVPGSDQGYGIIRGPIAFSKTSDRLAYLVAGRAENGLTFIVHVRDLAAGQENEFRDDRVAMKLRLGMGIAFSPDGQTIAVGCLRGVALFDVLAGNVRGTLRAERRAYYRDLRFTEDGRYLMAASLPRAVVFDTRSGKTIVELKGQKQDAWCCAALSPTAERIAAGSLQNAVALWDARTGQEVASIPEGLGSGFSRGECWVAFTSDGRTLLTASRGDLSRIFIRRRDAVDGKLIRQVEIAQPGESCPHLYPGRFSPDGALLALNGHEDGTRITPEAHKGVVTVDEGVVAIYDTSHLFEEQTAPVGERR